MATNGSTRADKLEFEHFYNIIDGEKRHTESTVHGINPATLQELPPVPVSTTADIDAAVKAARNAFRTWKQVSLEEREQCLLRFADAFEGLKDDFAKLLVSEQGKPLPFAKLEIDKALEWLRRTPELQLNEHIVEETEECQTITKYVPLGIVVGIVPWNFPLLLLIAKLAPCVYTGNTLILKPSPFTPYAGLKIIELAQQFFPRGVLQVLSGDDSLGPQLTSRTDINKISFTGSTATGKKIMESASKNLTRVTLELGGNDAAIVCADVDIAKTAGKMAGVAFYNSGQVCVAMKRIYVHESIYDEFLKAFTKVVSSFKVGNGADAGVFLGPVQNKAQYDRVRKLLQNITDSQQTLSLSGTDVDTASTGYFISPTIVDNPSEDSEIVQEEPFGPVVPLLKWSSEDDVIRRANDSDMGLGASVWSQDVASARRLGEQLEAGCVWINSHMSLTPMATMGGHKHSGIGGEWGVDGLKGYCNTQSLFVYK